MEINKGDFILTELFGEDEWAIFYQLMMDNGYDSVDTCPEQSDGSVWEAFGVHILGGDTYAYKGDDAELTNDISDEFREYLDNNKPKLSVSLSISPKPIVAIHKEDNASDSRLCYYARDLKHLLKQMDNDQESVVDYELFNLGEELELSLREKEL